MYKQLQACVRCALSIEVGAVWCGALTVIGALNGLAGLPASDAHAASVDAQPIAGRHAHITRDVAAGQPRRENDQVVVNGWPMYRTNRGQEAFNHAMATLRATDGPPPRAQVFRQRCTYLNCPVTLPRLSRSGWIPAGRLWVSPSAYVLIVHSPRRSKYDPGRRRSLRAMRYFVFHEFHNSTGNTDVFDTISAHRWSVFVPFYLGKPGRDAQGHNYVIVVQVAPHDIVSRHARVFGNAGPGIEVAKNRREPLSKLQAVAGIVVATIVKRAVRRLRMVHHRGTEGLPMLRAYRARQAAWKRMRGRPRLRLPFVAADPVRVANATGSLASLIVHTGPVRAMPPADLFDPGRSLLAGLPRLVSPPRLVEMVRKPVLTMDQLLARVLAMPLVAPKPRRVCRGDIDKC